VVPLRTVVGTLHVEFSRNELRRAFDEWFENRIVERGFPPKAFRSIRQAAPIEFERLLNLAADAVGVLAPKAALNAIEASPPSPAPFADKKRLRRLMRQLTNDSLDRAASILGVPRPRGGKGSDYGWTDDRILEFGGTVDQILDYWKFVKKYYRRHGEADDSSWLAEMKANSKYQKAAQALPKEWTPTGAELLGSVNSSPTILACLHAARILNIPVKEPSYLQKQYKNWNLMYKTDPDDWDL
jgi:hypothetical protein